MVQMRRMVKEGKGIKQDGVVIRRKTSYYFILHAAVCLQTAARVHTHATRQARWWDERDCALSFSRVNA